MRFLSADKVLLPDDAAAQSYVRQRDGLDVDLFEEGHSMPKHRLLFSFTQYLWEQYWQEKFPVFDTFRYYLSVCIGHHEITMRATSEGAWVEVLEARSWSLPKCSATRFDELMRLVSAWAERNHGITLDAWYANDPDASKVYAPMPKKSKGEGSENTKTGSRRYRLRNEAHAIR